MNGKSTLYEPQKIFLAYLSHFSGVFIFITIITIITIMNARRRRSISAACYNILNHHPKSFFFIGKISPLKSP